MITAMQVKAIIRNISIKEKVNPQILLRNFMFERILERISLSEYKYNFVLKGGLLIASMIGVDARSTMDMDATIKGLPVTMDKIKLIFEDLAMVVIDDGFELSIKDIDEIRDESDYNGFRVSLDTKFDSIKQVLKIDITTGDTITPKEIEYEYKLLMEERFIGVMAYNIETVIAEKLETIISRGTTNTRMRDFYDVFILSKLKSDDIDREVLKLALNETTKNRASAVLFENRSQIVSEIALSKIMEDLWNRYQRKYDYAGGITWNMLMVSVEKYFK